MCRTVLPPGPEELCEASLGGYVVIEQRASRGEASWCALIEVEQLEISEMILLWREAANQGHAGTKFGLEVIL